MTGRQNSPDGTHRDLFPEMGELPYVRNLIVAARNHRALQTAPRMAGSMFVKIWTRLRFVRIAITDSDIEVWHRE